MALEDADHPVSGSAPMESCVLTFFYCTVLPADVLEPTPNLRATAESRDKGSKVPSTDLSYSGQLKTLTNV